MAACCAPLTAADGVIAVSCRPKFRATDAGLPTFCATRMFETELFKVRKRPRPMDRVELMSLAASIAEAGGLSAASRKLGIPVPTVSRKLSELEARLKTQLFHR